MPERPRYSRFRRLPGLFRTGDAKPLDPNEEPVPLTVYLSGHLLDMAENLAARQGITNVQEYCEGLLQQAIEDEDEAAKQEAIQVTHGTFRSLDDLADDLANDPESLTEWSALARDQQNNSVKLLKATQPFDNGLSAASEIVFRHAGMGNEPESGLLPVLRRGEVIPAELADELIDALQDLEMRLKNVESLDRKLAYVLHRLAFEGQVLLTDSPSEAAADAATIERLRRVQEAVDRVLSGEDIRYYTESTNSSLSS